jgi:hypothetical protein
MLWPQTSAAPAGPCPIETWLPGGLGNAGLWERLALLGSSSPRGLNRIEEAVPRFNDSPKGKQAIDPVRPVSAVRGDISIDSSPCLKIALIMQSTYAHACPSDRKAIRYRLGAFRCHYRAIGSCHVSTRPLSTARPCCAAASCLLVPRCRLHGHINCHRRTNATDCRARSTPGLVPGSLAVAFPSILLRC